MTYNNPYLSRHCVYFRYKANHVSPTEIENILQEHPAVKACLVFGKKDPSVQELISAVVVPKANEKVRKVWLGGLLQKEFN